MGVLRERMVREMALREFSASTQKLYLSTLTDLARYHHRSPDTLEGTDIQDYLLYLTRERHLAWSSVSVAASAILSDDSANAVRTSFANSATSASVRRAVRSRCNFLSSRFKEVSLLGVPPEIAIGDRLPASLTRPACVDVR